MVESPAGQTASITDVTAGVLLLDNVPLLLTVQFLV